METRPEEMAQCLSVFTEKWSLIFITHSDGLQPPLTPTLEDLMPPSSHTHSLSKKGKRGMWLQLSNRVYAYDTRGLGIRKEREGG